MWGPARGAQAGSAKGMGRRLLHVSEDFPSGDDFFFTLSEGPLN